MSQPILLRDVVAALDARYRPSLAEDWDAVGLVCGDPSAAISRIHFAVDATLVTVEEAIASGSQLLITHHPLLFDPVQSVAATSTKGLIIHRLISNGVALFSAHTNADRANPGVSDALAQALCLLDVEVLEPMADEQGIGLGRIGRLGSPMRLADFLEHVSSALPVGVAGIKATGDPDKMVQRIAVCGGAGSSALPAVISAEVDAYVTSDLSHHRVGEFVDDVGRDGPVLIDASHFGTEWPWLKQATELLLMDLAGFGTTVETTVSTLSTDPWSIHEPKRSV
ncbi:unannotated protein [freshwater metagenome]|uniref:Unannotated protein n=1 Tax=freshwater metagenome TaxID=449393 RepID=A0A6J7EA59_9ZZZZ